MTREIKGYSLLRDADLSDKAWENLDTWTEGKYYLETIVEKLKKIDRPIPGYWAAYQQSRNHAVFQS